VRCASVAEQLLAPDDELVGVVADHLAGCERCTALAQRLGRLDALLQSTLVVAPPEELQVQLQAMARAAARPREPWWASVQAWLGGLIRARPHVAIAQGLAGLMLVVAGWQLLGWLNTFTPVIGDVPYAMALVAASPAAGYLGDLQIDLPHLALWSVVGLIGWSVSESGPLRSLGSRR
jgi:anti-sigma factor RsiW